MGVFYKSIKKAWEYTNVCLSKLINEPFVKITCTVVAGLVGGLLAANFQENSWREQNRLSMIESDRRQAEIIFNDVSRIMDDRFYKTVRLLSAYRQNDSIKIQKYRQSLTEQLEEWNANRHRVYSLLEGYYGVRFSDFFNKNIQHPFALTGNHIIYHGAKTKEDQIKIQNYLDSLEPNIAVLNKMMLTAIKRNQIGRFSEDSVDSFEPSK